MLTITDLTTTASGTRVYDASPFYPDYPVAYAVAPTVINSHSILANPAYWQAMRFLSENLASFPRSVHKNGAKRAPEDEAHPLERLLKRAPNACQNATIFWRTLFFHAAHAGNGYAEIVRDVAGQPLALRNLIPSDIAPIRFDRGDGRGALQYYLHQPTRRVIVGTDVIHLQALGYDGMSGADPASLHSETFQRAATIGRFQTKYLQRGTVIRGAIEIPGETTEEQDKQITNTVQTYFKGPEAERDVLILSGGAKLNNTTISPQESQLIEQGGHVAKQIAQLTGVPPQFLYEFKESQYNNAIEQMGQWIVRFTFRPWIEQTEDELSMKLLSDEEMDDGYRVKLNPDALLRGSTKEQVEVVATAVNAGLETRNEGRRYLGLPKDPDPESDRLKVLGDTNPGGTVAPIPAPRETEAADPESRETAAARPLNGYHVSAALKVIARLKAKKIGAVEAAELLVAVGIPRDRADLMVGSNGPAPAHLDSAQSKPDRPVIIDATNGPPRPDAFTILAPVITAACERVDRKTNQAFSDHEARNDEGRVPYFNALAERQARTVAETLTPLVASLRALGATNPPDVARVAKRYAAGIRKRAATGEAVNLADLLGA